MDANVPHQSDTSTLKVIISILYLQLVFNCYQKSVYAALSAGCVQMGTVMLPACWTELRSASFLDENQRASSRLTAFFSKSKLQDVKQGFRSRTAKRARGAALAGGCCLRPV